VSVRVRPLSESEAEKGSAWKIDGNTIQQAGRDVPEAVYNLDNIFDSSWTTEAIYAHTTKELVKKVVGGFNGTVFAYGQTSSGKTHTMRGTASNPGIVPLAVQDIFNHICGTQDREYLLRVSYMEVWRYNCEIDLLAGRSRSFLHTARIEITDTDHAVCRIAAVQ
jgi:centromeric protein E